MDIRRHVETTAAGLAREAKPERREVLVDLLLQWLQDGRTTPTHLAQALTKVIGTTEKGLTYLD